MLQQYCLLQSLFLLTILSITVWSFEGCGIPRLFNPVAQVTLRGFFQLVPISWRGMSSCSGCQSWFSLLISFSVLSNGGYEATPLQVERVPLLVGGSILHQTGRQVLSFLLTWGVLTHFTPPLFCLALPTMTQFCEWLHLS